VNISPFSLALSPSYSRVWSDINISALVAGPGAISAPYLTTTQRYDYSCCCCTTYYSWLGFIDIDAPWCN
jgi:hypothetical protein